MNETKIVKSEADKNMSKIKETKRVKSKRKRIKSEGDVKRIQTERERKEVKDEGNKDSKK